jgi:hypothetical protein
MAQEIVKLAQEITAKEAPEEALGIVLKTYLSKLQSLEEKYKELESYGNKLVYYPYS